MYCYIYDTFTSQKKYEKQLIKIEAALTDLGIMGKVYKLNVLKNLENIIEEALADGIKNIVAVGNDQTVSKVADQFLTKGENLGKRVAQITKMISTSKSKNNSED